MRAELIKRYFYIQQQKIDLLWSFSKGVAGLFAKNSERIPPDIRQGFIDLAEPFMDKYNRLVGDSDYEKEEE